MNSVFLKILNLSVNASWLILAVIVARFLVKKAPKWVFCVLWGLVALRLLIPFSLESALSLLPSNEPIPMNIETVELPQIETGIYTIDSAINLALEASLTPQTGGSINPMQIVVFVATIVWITGVSAMLIYVLISFILLKNKVKASIILDNGVFACDDIRSPFILGMFRPIIYIPSTLSGEALSIVLAHEQAHLKRLDQIWKPLGFILLSVYWFNPLCWLAYILLCRDIEAACDEKVIRDKDREYMALYSQTLLDTSVHRRSIAACPLAFGEVGVKSRVKSILNYKRPAFWLIILGLVVLTVLAVCFLTVPGNRIKKDPDRITSISVQNGHTGKYFEITDRDEIEKIVEYINSMKLTRGKFSAFKMGYYLHITFNPKRSTWDDVILTSPTLLRNDPFFYTISPETWLVEYMEALYQEAIQKQQEADAAKPRILHAIQVDLSASIGADPPELLYADKDRLIIAGYFGVIVYSKKDERIIQCLDLKEIDCHYTQGDKASEKFVRCDGNTIYLYRVDKPNEVYVVDLESGLEGWKPYDLSNVPIHKKTTEIQDLPVEKYDSWTDNGKTTYSFLYYADTIGSLSYAEFKPEDEYKEISYEDYLSSDYHRIFFTDPLTSGTHDVAKDVYIIDELSEIMTDNRAFTLDTSQYGGYPAYDHEVTLAEITAEDGNNQYNNVEADNAYVFVDLDGDGTEEMVYRRSNYLGYYVFRIYEDHIYGYEIPYRGMLGLKQDGTFGGSNAADDNGILRIFFDGTKCLTTEILWQHAEGAPDRYTIAGKSVSYEKYLKALESEQAKPNVFWQNWKKSVKNTTANNPINHNHQLSWWFALRL